MSVSDTLAADTKRTAHFRAEAVHRLYLGVKSVAHFLPLLPMLLVAGIWSHVSSTAVLLWLLAAVSMPVAQYLLSRRYFKDIPHELDAPRWGHYITGTALIDGIVWGTAGILFYLPGEAPQQLLLLALIIGIPAGSIFSTSWWPTTQYVNAGASVGLTAFGLLSRGTTGEIVMGAALLLYLVILYFIMREAHGTAMETIALRFDKEALIEQLQHEKGIAEQANLAKSKFLAAASHDLRQPLHAMMLFVAAMDNQVQPAETRAMLGNVQRCATALESLLQTLLDISKIDAGIIEPRLQDYRLAPLLRRLEAEFAIQAQLSGLKLTAQCDDLTVNSDPDLVERILRNLIANAIRYTHAGSVDVCCLSEAGGITLSVSDTGVGIPADQHERVFEEFVQLGNPERDRTKGLGLGLAIVRRLADLLDAPLTLDSQPGRGSAFRILLPAGDPSAAAERELTTSSAASSLSDMTVAVVDDEADVREGMRTLLEGWACQVVTGESALSILAELDRQGVIPDVVLADYRLRGETTGVQAIGVIHEHFGKEIPAAIITGDTAAERLIEVQASGYVLLHKPLRPAKLRVLLQNLRRGIKTG
jgi:signal transduction histidine kinase/CheY-like chemotaxis protein